MSRALSRTTHPEPTALVPRPGELTGAPARESAVSNQALLRDMQRRPHAAPVAMGNQARLLQAPPQPPTISPEEEAQMQADLEFILVYLRNKDLLAGSEAAIVERVRRWVFYDRRYSRLTGYEGTAYLDRFLVLLKGKVLNYGDILMDRHMSAYDILWHFMDDHVDEYKALVKLSRREGAPPVGPADSGWKALGKTFGATALGFAGGAAKGLGGAVDAGTWLVTLPYNAFHPGNEFKPLSYSQMIEEQIQAGGKEFFGEHWTQETAFGKSAGDLFMATGNAAFGVALAGGSGNVVGVTQWADKATTALYAITNLQGVAGNIENLFNAMLRVQDQLAAKGKRAEWTDYLKSAEVRMEAANTISNIYGAIMGIPGNKIQNQVMKRLAIYMDALAAGGMAGRIIEILASDMPREKKMQALGPVLIDWVTKIGQIALGTFNYRKEFHGQAGQGAPAQTPPQHPPAAAAEPKPAPVAAEPKNIAPQRRPSRQERRVKRRTQQAQERAREQTEKAAADARRAEARRQRKAAQAAEAAPAPKPAPEEPTVPVNTVEHPGNPTYNEWDLEGTPEAARATPHPADPYEFQNRRLQGSTDPAPELAYEPWRHRSNKRGKKTNKRPKVEKVPATYQFGEASGQEHLTGTHRKTGMHFGDRNAAEIAIDYRIEYDGQAGQVQRVSYRVAAQTPGQPSASHNRYYYKDATIDAPQPDPDAFGPFVRGHVAQFAAGGADPDVRKALNAAPNLVPMTPALNQGAGSTWTASERQTLQWADQYGHVRVVIEPTYGVPPRTLANGTPIPDSFRRRIYAPDGTLLEDRVHLNR